MLDNLGVDTGFVQDVALDWGLRLVTAALVFLVGKWLAGVLSRTLGRVVTRTGTDATLVSFLVNISHVAMVGFVVIAALAQLGLETTSFIAVLGAAGLAIGLALQGSLSNFAAGVMLILFKPFKAGDYVEAGGAAGTVEAIQIFSTQMRSPDNKVLFMPNGAIFSGKIVNYSARDTRRLDLVYGCGYGDDLAAVKALLNDILASEPRVLSEPAPTVGVLELADSSVNFAVRPWVSSADYFSLLLDLNEQVKLRFDAAGLNIPHPQHTVHLRQAHGA